MLAFDTTMAIIKNVPPGISFSELDVQLPCNSPYFELASYSDMPGQATFPKPRIKLVDAFQKLFAPPSELAFVVEKDCLNYWDMLYLIHCLYTYFWRQTFANPLLRSSASTLLVVECSRNLEACDRQLENVMGRGPHQVDTRTDEEHGSRNFRGLILDAHQTYRAPL